MKDKTFEKQLKKFGVESERIEVSASKPSKPSFNENTPVVIRALMDSTSGRQWVYDWLVFTGVNAQSYIPGRPEDTAFQCGIREMGLHLQREIESITPEKYYLMVEEASARKKPI